jgi:hypothetical protein
MSLFTSKELESEHHQNGSAGPGSKYALLPLHSSSSTASPFSSVFARHRLGFVSNGIAKRLVVALFIGLACVAGLSLLLPVRNSPSRSSTQPNPFFPKMTSFRPVDACSHHLLHSTVHRVLFAPQIIGAFNACILLLSNPLPSISTTAGRVIAVVAVQDIS